jgi:hypothetical protein
MSIRAVRLALASVVALVVDDELFMLRPGEPPVAAATVRP